MAQDNPDTGTPEALARSKVQLRHEAYAARKRAHLANGAAASLTARDAFLAAGLANTPTIVSGYCPIRTELDPTPLMEALAGAGHRLCVPVIEGQGRPLSFREWTPGCAMIEGPFGASVPAEGTTLEPRILIVPLVAFDANCWRLGYGGGFYDRTLELLRACRATTAVGIAYAAQEVPSVPREATDQPLDAVVTEGGIIRAGGKS